MRKIIRVGVDLAKNVIQVHAVDEHGTVVVARALRREKFITWCVQLPAGCLIAMEACSGAHHWCRKLQALGFDARMIPAQFVAPIASRATAARTTPTTRQPCAKLPRVPTCTSSPPRQ